MKRILNISDIDHLVHHQHVMIFLHEIEHSVTYVPARKNIKIDTKFFQSSK
jgi:hypothetical protein